MDLGTYAGILAGGDVLSEPPGVPLLGQSEFGATDFNWDDSKLHARLRNNRMPPGWEFDITETNRDGLCVEVSADGVAVLPGQYGCELNGIGVIAAWVTAGAPETDPFDYGGFPLDFDRDVLAFFTQPNMWYEGSQACTGCHFANSEASYHEMDLGTYAGILAGGDVVRIRRHRFQLGRLQAPRAPAQQPHAPRHCLRHHRRKPRRPDHNGRCKEVNVKK
jgi:hypothetical protein